MFKQPKVFILTSTPPLPTWGGAMTFYRHFVERKDFDTYVATDNEQIQQYTVPYPYTIFTSPSWLKRLTLTRFSAWAHSLQHILAGNQIPSSVLEAATNFQPDLIFTVGGSWSWTSLMASRLSSKLKVPLIVSFNDWFNYNIISHPWLISLHRRMFYSLYRQADLALCTSEGMLEELGPHPNAHILYPTGALIEKADKSSTCPIKNGGSPYIVAFAGNLGEWYGQMLERLIKYSWNVSTNISFRIYGSVPSWSHTFGDKLREMGVYRGQVSFDTLRQEMRDIDALLLPMGFDKSSALIERTSFKTKFLDYLAFQKPIVVWGPEYCSAVRVAKEFQSAQVCTSADEADCFSQINRLASSPAIQRSVLQAAQQMYQDRFHPDRIHLLLLEQCEKLIVEKAKRC